MEQDFVEQFEDEGLEFGSAANVAVSSNETDDVGDESKGQVLQDGESLIRLAKSSSGLAIKKKGLSLRDEVQSEAEGWLTVDVYETPTDIFVESAIAGITPEELDITASPDSLTIRGERKRNEQVRKENYLYQECYWGKFSRSVILPQEINPEAASVNFQNGILTVRLPKARPQQPKKLRVERS